MQLCKINVKRHINLGYVSLCVDWRPVSNNKYAKFLSYSRTETGHLVYERYWLNSEKILVQYNDIILKGCFAFTCSEWYVEKRQKS